MRRTIQTLISMRLHPDIFTRTEHHIKGSGGFLIATPAPLTLPPTIAASHLPLRPVLPHFCVTPSFADMCPRGSREPWTSIAAILSGHPRPARRARLSLCPILRGRHRSPPPSGATPPNMACGPAAPTIKQKFFSAPSTRAPGPHFPPPSPPPPIPPACSRLRTA